MIYDKPYKNTQELIGILEDRELHFIDRNTANDLLNTVGYYDLINAYKKFFYKSTNPERYKENLSFEYLYNFYYVDKEFQNVMLNGILLIENIFKNKISQILSSKYGVHQDDYMSKNIFQNKSYRIDGKKTHSNTFIKQLYDKKVNSNNPCNAISHYKNRHNHIPAWILFKDFTFMEIINFYRFLNTKDQEDIADKMIVAKIPVAEKVKHLKKMLQFLRKNRNIIAHNDLFIGNRVSPDMTNPEINTMLPNILKTISTYQSNTYSLICFIIILLDAEILRRNFIARIKRMNIYNGNNYLNTYYNFLKLPKDFNVIIDNYHKILNNNNLETMIKGNKKRKIYHLQNGVYYNYLKPENTIYFNDENEAVLNGYRKSNR
ncbi:Abi family protein [Peptostreptococcus porci]|uniref:Abi family protein n=1 Tax=Peptostreptococcus porci TaxID=2652282 RepID=UPI002A7F58D8|nr:Abi family protein [Peptostreptococcus porci]MDY4128668.1 Abi family protein [Peptostreptococcus porci]